MATCLRLATVLLIMLLDVMVPPAGPPGADPARPPQRPTVPCPERGCHGRGRWQQRISKYRCDERGHFFNYCTFCKSGFSDGQSGMHNHPVG